MRTNRLLRVLVLAFRPSGRHLDAFDMTDLADIADPIIRAIALVAGTGIGLNFGPIPGITFGVAGLFGLMTVAAYSLQKRIDITEEQASDVTQIKAFRVNPIDDLGSRRKAGVELRNRPIFAKELDAWLEESEGWRSGVLSAVRGISVAEFHIFDTLDGLPDTVYPSSTLTRYDEFGED